MKKYLIIAIIVLLAVIGAMWQQVRYANEKWEKAEANVKAYSFALSGEKGRCSVLQLTVDQLDYFKDSVLQELDDTRKKLKVKDKNLKALQSVKSSFSRKDTVTLRDTLFREPSLAIDTMIGDEWYQLQLGLRYPSTVVVKPHFRSKKHIVVSNRKETVNPPKKFFLFRWFQRKHWVVEVKVEEKSPYVDNESSRYVEIVK